MEISQLRYFLKVAERENFTRAAEDLHLSQPALSRAIARLETELGQPVFERHGRRVSLTLAGTLLQARAQQILTLVDDTRTQITDDGSSGRIRLAAIPTIAPYFLPRLIRSFRQVAPAAHLLVQEDVTENILKRCSQGEIDVAILALPVPARYIEVEPLLEEELILVLPPGHPLATRRQVKPADVEPFPFVLLGEAHCLADNITTFCRQQAFHPVAVERTSQLATVQELVSLGHGVSLIPAMARALDASQRRVYRCFTGERPTRQLAMCWNPHRFRSRLLARFQQHVRDYSAQIAQELATGSFASE